MPLPSHLLVLPAEAAVRLIALDFLTETMRARARLDDSSDAEALHDFRVALRRLRSCLRTYRPQLDRSVPGRLRRRLRRFARAAGGSRDLEVQVQWLRRQLADVAPQTDCDARAILDDLEARKARADGKLRDLLKRSFAETTAKVKRRLRDYRARLDPDQARQDLAGTLVADRIRELADDLEQALANIGSVDEIERVHEARIAAKHVRYALEPIEPLVEIIAPVIARLKSFQDILGTLHDSQVFQQRLEPDDGAGSHPELAWLRDRLQQQGISAMEHLRREWLTVQPAAPPPLPEEVRAVADHIAPRSDAVAAFAAFVR